MSFVLRSERSVFRAECWWWAAPLISLCPKAVFRLGTSSTHSTASRSIPWTPCAARSATLNPAPPWFFRSSVIAACSIWHLKWNRDIPADHTDFSEGKIQYKREAILVYGLLGSSAV